MSNPYDTLKERTSILGPTIQFKGELSADEDLIINGTIEGSITRMQRLTIGRDGKVHANVDAQLVVIEGTIHGDVRAAKSVSVAPTAHMAGNITAPSVAIQEGAKFNGSVDMSEGSVAQDSASPAAAGLRRPSSAA
jgi:cytoskeletal protein CcmA (bactofilin family)